MSNDWVKTEPVYRDVTESRPHCPYCLDEIDSNYGDYPRNCKCGKWDDGFYYKRSPTKEELARKKAHQDSKNRIIQKKRETAIYNRVKRELEQKK